MHQYFIHTPWLIQKLFSQYVWRLPNANNEVYLTFDDGPHPEITPWVLEQLRIHDAKATFFCIGKNVALYPRVYEQILAEGHAVGNHTQNHLNGWKTDTSAYIENIKEAGQRIDTSLFRPPYGRMKRKHLPLIRKALQKEMKVIMWDVLSADFDTTISPETCMQNVTAHVHEGSIVVFHDSEKAFPNLKWVLPKVLEEVKERGFGCKSIYL